MSYSNSPTMTPSPRRELQGPRPTPLKVCKDSHKIKKPPMAPPLPTQQDSNPPQHRPPVIIYTVSPKIIHTNPGDFMALVQRLTGASPVAAADNHPSSSPSPLPSPCCIGAISPAARLASFERSTPQAVDLERGFDDMGIDGGSNKFHPGILSPVPSSLPAISPNFFTHSAVDPNAVCLMRDQSPTFHVNKTFVDNTFLVSPNYTFFSSPIAAAAASPGSSYWDLFDQYQHF